MEPGTSNVISLEELALSRDSNSSKSQDRSPITITNLEFNIAIVRTHFPNPTKYSLPSLFKGANISDYLECFKEAYTDSGITKDVEKVSHFNRWYNLTHKHTIQGFEEEDKATWEQFTKALK